MLSLLLSHTSDNNKDNTCGPLGYSGCGKCLLCSYSELGSKVENFQTGYIFKIKHNFTCRSKNVIYLIWLWFNGVKIGYVGFTTDPRSRFSTHKSQVNGHKEGTKSHCKSAKFLIDRKIGKRRFTGYSGHDVNI